MNTQAKPAAKKAATSGASAAKKVAAGAENVVNLNNKALQGIQDSISAEAQKTQEKLYEMGREGAEKFAKSADAAGQAIYEVANICRDNVEACVESGNIAASICKDFSEELTEYASQTANESVELSKEFFACRTLNDVMELQNRVLKNSVETYFEQCSRVTNAMFECMNEICEPINQRIAESSEQFGKLLSAKTK